MLRKYEVGAGDEFVGVYYAESKEEAIQEARQDFHWNVDGTKTTLKDLGIPSKDLIYNMVAREAI